MIDVQGSYTMPLLVGLGLGLISLLLLTLLRTTPSGNIAVPGAQSDVIPGPGNEIALAIIAFDETLMELEDWLEP